MTVSRDLVNHKMCSWHKIDARNGKSTMQLLRLPNLKSLLSERFNGDFNVKKKSARFAWKNLVDDKLFQTAMHTKL